MKQNRLFELPLLSEGTLRALLVYRVSPDRLCNASSIATPSETFCFLRVHDSAHIVKLKTLMCLRHIKFFTVDNILSYPGCPIRLQWIGIRRTQLHGSNIRFI